MKTAFSAYSLLDKISPKEKKLFFFLSIARNSKESVVQKYQNVSESLEKLAKFQKTGKIRTTADLTSKFEEQQ